MVFGGGLQPFTATRRVDLPKSCRKWSPHFLVQTGLSPRVICLVTPIPAVQMAIQADFISLLHLDMPDLSPDWFTFPDLSTATAGCSGKHHWKTQDLPTETANTAHLFRPWGHEREDWQLFGESSGATSFHMFPWQDVGGKYIIIRLICVYCMYMYREKDSFLVYICFYILLLCIYRTVGICPFFMTYLGLDKQTVVPVKFRAVCNEFSRNRAPDFLKDSGVWKEDPISFMFVIWFESLILKSWSATLAGTGG